MTETLIVNMLRFKRQNLKIISNSNSGDFFEPFEPNFYFSTKKSKFCKLLTLLILRLFICICNICYVLDIKLTHVHLTDISINIRHQKHLIADWLPRYSGFHNYPFFDKVFVFDLKASKEIEISHLRHFRPQIHRPFQLFSVFQHFPTERRNARLSL